MKLFYSSQPKKAFRILRAKNPDGVRVRYVNGVSGAYTVKIHKGFPRRKLRAFVGKTGSGFVTSLTFEVTV